MPFKTFGLSDSLVQGVLATGYTVPTDIQSQAIPAAVGGRDIIGCAQTGTGKTAAFVLPILNRLCDVQGPRKKGIKSLILTPTRELAVQIERSILGHGRFLSLRTLAVYGGVSINRQLDALRRGVDIVVATPGRLMDHMQRGTIDFKHVEVLVLDEADRMLDMGFIRDVRRIVAALPTNRQTMLFSATMPPEVKAISRGMQKSPAMIQIGRPHNPIETITQHVYSVPKRRKMDLLQHMLREEPMYSVLVFSRTKHGADKISRRLERAGVRSVSIHSGRSQSQRQRALDGFRDARHQVLVATDIAARGIDVQGITHVVNFDVPAFAEDYLHRIGRTGRADATGDAITLVSADEREYLRKIERFIGRKLSPTKCPDFAYDEPEAVKPQPAQRSGSRRRTGKRAAAATKSTVRTKPRVSRQRRRKALKRQAI